MVKVCCNISDITARVMDFSEETSYLVSRLFYEPHIYQALDNEMRDVYTVHRILKEIEEVDRVCIGFFTPEDHFCGCIHFSFTSGIVEPHIMLCRGVNGVDAVLKGIMEAKRFYRKNHILMREVRCNISENNRAIRMLLKRCGFEYIGKDEKFRFYDRNNSYACLIYGKEI